MWYDDLEDRAEAKAEAETDAYWDRLEAFWYIIRPHTLDKDFEELNVYELSQLKRDYIEHEECRLLPEQFYGVSR